MPRILAIAFLALITLTARAQNNLPPATPADGQNPFGVVEAMWFPDIACDLGVGWERIIFDWGQHQPNGPDDWYTLNVDDRWLRAASDCNREVVAVIKNVPAWATDGRPGIGVPRGLDLPLDDPGNVWAAFMRRAAAYYAPRGVHRFIILNEPDIDRETYGFEFEGELEDYFNILKTAYLAARQGNPAARVHLAGTTYWHDINAGRRLYLDRLFERIMADPDAPANGYYFDALSLHIYFRSESIPFVVGKMQELLDRYGLGDKPIWINEYNTSPNLDPAWPVTRPQFQVNLAQQQAFLVQATALALASGVQRMSVYKLWDQNAEPGIETFGLLTPGRDDHPPRPAYYTYRALIDVLQGIERTAWATTPEVYAVRLERGAGQVVIAWARTAAASAVTVDGPDGKAYLMDLEGDLRVIRPDGEHALTGATCDERDGCAVGGPPLIVLLPPGDVTLTAGGRVLAWQSGIPESSLTVAQP
ncbi:MAG: hypothetical protein IT298_12080 [Chloroflexi bacterium]|nr:MAG: hypothetical protein UZ13_03910 [Chloroflexi bacterium OLB13]MBC6957853.1 hypothetical protein [Chloroflexota bacterium]MBV6436832.1 hypothetical protein [Anaerolineae bacterium]MDL1917597.1 hypothetical protein [Anaerolineae bacterium CFX4]OQY81649.1 MAG: hypothetical protein B6D42_10835 [Anaerolineae bacterium UTCFX5]